MSPVGASGAAILSSAQMGLTYAAQAISMTDGWLNRGGGLTGISDGTFMLANGWFRRTGGDGSARRILSCHATFNSRLIIQLAADNTFYVEARNSSNTPVLIAVGPTVTDSDWHQWAVSINLANAAQRNMIFDGADAVPTWSTYSTAETIDFAPTTPEWVVARYQPSGSIQPWIGDLSDMWFSTPGAWVDLSGANLANFISGGKPVNPATAISAFGTPLISLHGGIADYATNADGSGGAFAVNGTLAVGSGPVQL